MLKTAPHVIAVFDADLSAIIAHRQGHQEAYRQEGVRLTYTAYFVAAAMKALQAVPEVNSRWHEDALEIFSDYNIGVASAVEGGLLVPVLHRAQTLDLFGIASRLQDLTTQGAGRETRAGRIASRHLHDHQSWCERQPDRHAHHSSAADRHPWYRQNRKALGGCGGKR